jgi:M6 family metalloprotease-like protein
MLVFLAVVVCVMSAGVGAAAVITVDDSGGADFTSIQAAVDAAAEGDTIEVRSGTYVENVDVNKQLTLIGEGADAVTVQAANAGDHVFEVGANWVDIYWVNISGFTVTGATGRDVAGIYLDDADYCSISDINTSNNQYGIYLYSSSGNKLTNNTASNNDYGIYLYPSSNQNTLTSNTANLNSYGIYLLRSNSNTLTDNTANSNSYGITLSTSSYNTLKSNTASNNDYGIYLYYSSSSTFTDNTANSNSYGIYTYYSSSSTFTDNTANSNSYGITLLTSSINTLQNNTATNSNDGHGISLGYSSNYNMLIKNTANSNNGSGIYQYSSSNNKLIGNNASNNYYGISLISSSNNLIYQNNLINNINYNAYDGVSNNWDNGTIGNHYNNFDEPGEGCIDSNNNGICDSSYSIPGGSSVDRYPLIEPYSSPPSDYEGKLLRQTGDFKVYLIEDGKKRHFTSLEALEWNGYNFDDVIEVSEDVINSFELSSDITITQAIINKYNVLGGAATFGPPAGTGEQSGYPDNAGVICTYVNFQNGAIEYFTNGDQTGNAYAILNPFFNKWASMGYGKSVLGYPISDMSDTQTSSLETPFKYQNFTNGTERGALEYNLSSGEVFEIHGAIFAKWEDEGFAGGIMGLVTEDEKEAAKSPYGTTGRYSKFENGTIHWISNKTGDNVDHLQRGQSFITYSDLDKVYTDMGGTYSWLGFPVMDQEIRDGHGYCEFEGGYIEWDGSGYKTVIDLGEETERHKYEVRVSNIDDIGEIRVNGHLIARAEYPNGDSGWVDIHEPRGDNFIDFKVINKVGDWTYKFEFRKNGEIIWEDSCGEAGVPGKSCNQNTDTGLVYHKALRFENKAPVNVNVIFATFNDFDDINPLLPQSPKLEISKYATQFNNIHNYYEQNSYGAINLNFNVANSHKNDDEYEWYRLGNNFDYYISNPLSLPLNNDLHLYSNRNGVKLNFAKDAIEIADNAINYNDFDINLLIYPPAVYSYLDPKLTTEIFPLGDGNAEAWPINYSTTDSENARNWIVLSVKTSGLNEYWQGDSEETWAHELGHQMGSLHHLITPDLYNGGSSVGNWDIMHHNYSYMSSFSKEWVGWLNYQDESEFREYEIFPLNNLKLGDNVIKYTPTTTSYILKPYYIFEYRKAEGFDAILNNDENKLNSNNPNGAILIYKVKNCGTYYGTQNRLNGEDEIDKCIVNVINQDYTSVEEPTLYNEVKSINDLIYLDSNIIDPTKDDYEIKYINFAMSKDPDGNSAKINVKEETVVKSKGVYLKMLNDFIKNLDITFSSPSDDNLQPTLTLHAYSDDGKHVGMNYETGEYEVQIPGAMTSGLQPNGHEWILVPEDINIKYRVDSYANAEYLRQNLDINTDGFDLYEFVGLYFDENGNSHLEIITQSIPPGVKNEHSVMITQNSDGSYSLDIMKQYNITFLPPITTMDQFNLTDGSTLPIKFTARNSTTDEFIYDDTVNVTITNSTGHLITYFTNGTDTDSIRIDTAEEQYAVDFNTLDYPELTINETYSIQVTFGNINSLQGYAIAYFTLVDRTPPSPITNLHSTPGPTHINWTWTNPPDPDFNHTEVYLNGTFITTIPAPQNYYNATGLLPDTSYELSTRTVDASGNINQTWKNATASTLPLSDITSPTVTNPTSGHEIPDDTDNEPLWGETAQLNVTVIDDSGVASVTVNLSEIGGPAVKPMTNIEGNIWSTTTNASAGTLPKIYNLTVNATDIFRNSNTSVTIPIKVMKNGDTTGNGVVNIGDALRCANNVSFPGNAVYAISSPYVADVTGNGVINIGDCLRLANNVSFPGNPSYILK